MLPESAWPTQMSKSRIEEQIKLGFEKGELTSVNDKLFDHPTEAIQLLQSLAGPYGIGRDIHVGDTIIGIKGRVGLKPLHLWSY
jgi:argininosuccinate synthase